MDFPTKLGLALAVASFGLSLIGFFAPYEWKAIPGWLRRGGLAIGALVAVASTAVLLLIPPAGVPDVRMAFVGKKEPTVELLNPSDAVARDIKYSVELWNLSKRNEKSPLPIPTLPFDFIRPHESGGPENIFSFPHVSSSLKEGDELFGYSSVGCPTCSRWHFYWVYIEWHKEGYFCELAAGSSPQPTKIIAAMSQIAQAPAAIFAQACPPRRKQEIKDLPQ